MQYKDKGLVVLGFDCADDKQIALEMLRDNGVTFPNIIDSSDAAVKVCFQEYQGKWGSAVPMSCVIDREGKVVLAWYGYEEGHSRALAALTTTGGELAEAARQKLYARVGLLRLAKGFGIVPDLSELGKDQPPKVEVLPGSLAEKAGIRSGDRITAFNGRTVKRIEDVPAVWSQLNLLGGLRLSLLREGQQVELNLLAELLKRSIGSSDQDTPRQ